MARRIVTGRTGGSAAMTSPTLPWRARIPHLATVAYVAALAIWTDEGNSRAWLWSLVAIAIVLRAAGRASRVARIVGWGLAVVVASMGAAHDSRAVEACRAIAVLACAVGAIWAIATIRSDGGLVVGARPPSPMVGAIVLAVAWWAAVLARLGPNRASISWLIEYPSAWQWSAILLTAASFFGWTEWVLGRRSLELGVVERATAMRGLLWTLLLAMVLVGILGQARADGTACLALAIAGALLAASARHPDPVAVGRAARRVVVLALVGGPVAMLGASVVANGFSDDAWLSTLVTVAVALAIGTGASSLEGPLRPAGGTWLEAFARASDEAIRPDPEEGIRAALLALRTPEGAGAPSPELWTVAPILLTTVDAAGYLHPRDGELPETLMLVAAAEPEATLRAEVLDALEVRRPELRPLVRWMSDRGALLATVIACDGETEGVLVLPRGKRQEPVTLEEVRAFKRIADRLAMACRTRGTQTRMLERARDAGLRAQKADDTATRLSHARTVDAKRDILSTERLARPATVGVYSAASRSLLEALERRTSIAAPIVVVAPSGTDPVPYLARAHLAGARAQAPMVLVDGTSVRDHDVARWTDPNRSPLALADRGLLVLLDGTSLPADIQQLVARASAERRAPWERADPLDFQIALTTVGLPEELAAQGRLDAELAVRLGDALSEPLLLPRLRDRPEDLRAIVTDRLAREGLRVLGRPVGIDHAAYARLVDYDFPGEDVELAAMTQRLVRDCAGDVVRAADVDRLGLGASPLASSRPPSPSASSRPPSPSSPSASSRSTEKGRKDPLLA